MTDKRLLPVWLLGFANLPLGLGGGLALLSVPQLLSSRHVPEPVIAELTTLALVPSFVVFLLGPLLDIRFSRRSYAVAATVLTAATAGIGILFSENLLVLGAAMFAAGLGASINYVAIGGWFGTLVQKDKDATLGAWMTAANITGFGAMAMIAIQTIRALPLPLAALALAAPNLLPLLIYAVTPSTPPDQKLAKESFGQFFRDLGHLVRQPVVLRTVLLFAVPAASFALTNTLGGLGRDYHADEAFVGVIGGAAAIGAGLVGSLLVPLLARWAPSRPLYIGIGILGALFTLSLLVLPHTPAVFATAMIGENVAQSAALALVAVIALQSLGKDNPFAATQFGLLICASALPITYMQLLDGHAYGAGGLALMYLTDAGLGLVACLTLAALLWRWSRRDRGPGAT